MLPEKHPGIHTAWLQSKLHAVLKVWLEEAFYLTLFFLTVLFSPGVPSFWTSGRAHRSNLYSIFLYPPSCKKQNANIFISFCFKMSFLTNLKSVQRIESVCFILHCDFFSLSGPSCLWEDSWTQLHVFPPTAKATWLTPVSHSHAPRMCDLDLS